MELPGVLTFRDIDDVNAITLAKAAGSRVVVIGGGLLGLEAAYGLAKAGANVTVIHLMDRLMERQLDQRAALMLKRAVEAKGITVRLETETKRIVGDSRVEAVETKDGSVIPADAVVVAIGIRPNVDLAREAGLAVNRGILIDDHIETAVRGIHAIGECAEHRGICYGLVEPAYEQARTLARRLAGEDAAYPGSVLATNLKVSGVSVFSAGDFMGTASRRRRDRAERPRSRRLQEARRRQGPADRRGPVRRYLRWAAVSQPHAFGPFNRACARRPGLWRRRPDQDRGVRHAMARHRVARNGRRRSAR